MNATRTAANRRIAAAFALASLTTLMLLSGIRGLADGHYLDERTAQAATPAAQQVVVVATRSTNS